MTDMKRRTSAHALPMQQTLSQDLNLALSLALNLALNLAYTAMRKQPFDYPSGVGVFALSAVSVAR
jgi:hypothetical protein